MGKRSRKVTWTGSCCCGCASRPASLFQIPKQNLIVLRIYKVLLKADFGRSANMWLINVNTMKLELFQGAHMPPYGILSHTWGDHEPSFRDLDNWCLTSKKPGAQKIELTCRQAKMDGLNYAWVDTCCIDQNSSAELAEAINSMFIWYKKAERCYAFLSDVEKDHFGEQFPRSRWFTRGWTLQELIAPRTVNFYDANWEPIGSKHALVPQITAITKIDQETLKGANIEIVSIAKRMSWAANRQTTRVEDLAYCLLGIFNINMPMLYGEGERAFRRLQEEIFRSKHSDQSLFAWGVPPNLEIIDPHAFLPRPMTFFAEQTGHAHPITTAKAAINGGWTKKMYAERKRKENNSPTSLHGLFARSAADFKDSGKIVPCNDWLGNSWQFPPQTLSGGVTRLTFPVFSEFQFMDGVNIAITGCYVEHTNLMIGILFKHWTSTLVGRLSQVIGVPSTIPQVINNMLRSCGPLSFADAPSHMLGKGVRALVHIQTASLNRHGYELTKVICSSSSSWNGSTTLLLDWFHHRRTALLVFRSDTGHAFWILLACIHGVLLLRGGLCEEPESVNVPLNELLPPSLVIEEPESMRYPSKHKFFPECTRDHQHESECKADADFLIEESRSDMIDYGMNRWTQDLSVPNKKSRLELSAHVFERPMSMSKESDKEYDLVMDIHDFSPIDEVIPTYDSEGERNSSQSNDDEWTTTASVISDSTASKRRYQRTKPRVSRIVRFTKGTSSKGTC
jgi:hypothetical protein